MSPTRIVITHKAVRAARPRKPTVAAALGEIHRMWLDEACDRLAPAMAPEADFWDGWSAVRYLDGKFARMYRRQRAFIEAMLPCFRSSDAQALKRATARLEKVRRELDRLGRRRGAVRAVAAASVHFLELFEAWLDEIRRLTRGLGKAELPAPARQALAQLQATAVIRRLKTKPRR